MGHYFLDTLYKSSFPINCIFVFKTLNICSYKSLIVCPISFIYCYKEYFTKKDKTSFLDTHKCLFRFTLISPAKFTLDISYT